MLHRALLLDLKLLGLWRSVPAASLIRPTVPQAATDFVLAATSGIMMPSFNTTDYHGNPFLWIKFPVIVVGLANVAIVQRLVAWKRAAAGALPESGDRTVLAISNALSLAIWSTVLACGRMIGYWQLQVGSRSVTQPAPPGCLACLLALLN